VLIDSTLGTANGRRGADRAKALRWAAVLAVGAAAAMLAVPPLISWLTQSSGTVGELALVAGFGPRSAWSLPALTALAGTAAAAKYVQAGLARWNAIAGEASVTELRPGLLTWLAGWLRQQLTPWLAGLVVALCGTVLASLDTGDPALKSFVTGLRADQDAVTNGLSLRWSSGAVEGHVNRIKMLKRQMYGRASPDLLRRRVLLAD